MGELQQLLDNGYAVIIMRRDTDDYAAVAVKPSCKGRPLVTYLDEKLDLPRRDASTAMEAIRALAEHLFKGWKPPRAGRRRA